MTQSSIVCPFCALTFISKSGLASHLRWKHKEADSQAQRLTSPEPPRDSRSQMHDDHQSPDKTPELACNNSATDPLINQHCIGSSADQPHEAFRHSATVNSELDSINSFPRICVPPARASTLWKQADETIDLGLMQSCPAFNSLSADKMISTLVNAIHAYFPSSDTPSRKHKTENKKDRLKHLRNRKRQLRK